MKRISSALAALALALVSAAAAYAANPPAGEEHEGKPPPVATYRINAIGGSGQSGTVTLKQLSPTQTQVTIALHGEPASASEPSHIHTGACPSPGAVKWPLSNVVHGTSVSTIDVPYNTVNQSGFAVNIHESAAAIGIYKACGNISP